MVNQNKIFSSKIKHQAKKRFKRCRKDSSSFSTIVHAVHLLQFFIVCASVVSNVASVFCLFFYVCSSSFLLSVPREGDSSRCRHFLGIITDMFICLSLTDSILNALLNFLSRDTGIINDVKHFLRFIAIILN